MNEKSFSPLAIENFFVNTLSSLSILSEERDKLLVVSDFVEKTKELPEDFTFSYYLQLSKHFFHLSTSADLDPLPPDEIINFIDISNLLRERLRERIKEEVFISSQTNFYHYLALNYFYLGEIEKGYSALKKSQFLKNASSEEEEFVSNKPIFNEAKSNFELFKNFVSSSKFSPFTYETLNYFLEKWKKFEEGVEEDQINCILLGGQGSSENKTGRILPLTVFSKSVFVSENSNFVHFHNASLPLKNELINIASDAVSSADALYRKLFKKDARSCYLYFSFPEKGFIYSGRSIGLAIALLAYNQKLKISKNREILRFKKNTLFSGDVTLKGEVEKVEGIKEKVKAAFFSPVRYLVVPKGNFKEAISYLHHLQSIYPERRLEIIGVENIEDVVKDKRIITSLKIPLIKYTISKTSFLSKVTIFLILLISFLYSFILLLRNPQLHFWKIREPASAEFSDSLLKVFNRDGQLLNIYRLEDPPNQLYSGNFIFSDINNDSKKEILFSYMPKSNELQSSKVICLSHNGEKIWEYKPGRKLTTRKESFSNNYKADCIKVVDFKNDGRKNIIVGANHMPWYPFQISILNKDGKVEGEYWNSGHLPVLIFEDLDGDGIKEIIMGGTNNGYKRACLLVLDSRRIEGCSPQDDTPDYKFIGMKKGTEKYYILFPRSIICNTFQIRNIVSSIIFLRSEKKIEVNVLEHIDTREYILKYIFDYNMNPIYVEADDYFFLKLKELKAYGIISSFSEEEIYGYKNQLEYWDGEKWVKIPTMTKYWKKYK